MNSNNPNQRPIPQRPVQQRSQGQRAPMGAQQRPQQTPYRTPAPGPQRASGMRPANGYPQEPDHGARYGKAFLIILIVTAILLVVGLVTLCIVLLSNNDKDKE